MATGMQYLVCQDSTFRVYESLVKLKIYSCDQFGTLLWNILKCLSLRKYLLFSGFFEIMSIGRVP